MTGNIKRIFAVVMVLAILLSVMPITASAASNPITMTVVSEDGTPVTGATVTAYAYYTYSPNLTYDLTCQEQGSGRYYVYRDSYTARSYSIVITVSAVGYEEQSVTVRGNVTSSTMTLKSAAVVEDWQEFEMFYYLNGNEENPFPNSYAGAGNVGNYGPSQNNMPFVILNVNIAALQVNYPGVVVYGEHTPEGNTYQFTPVESENKKEAVKAFWQAVLECADEESIAALEATGLADWFYGYAAKYDGGTYHIDGILEVSPPVYSIELYKDETASGGTYSYVGGLLTNQNEEFKTLNDVLTALEGYLGYTITWQQDENGKPVAVDGVYTGTYIHEKRLHTITIYQSNADRATVKPETSEISYEPKSDYYYVAYYVLKVQAGQQVEFQVTYTDGDANDTAFTEHSYGVKQTGSTAPGVPAFTGNAVREGYKFLGWIMRDGDGTLLSDADIAKMTLTSDLIFDAEWEPLPQIFTGTVYTILNGTYDATTHTITSGIYVDVDVVLGKSVQLYLKEANGTDYIPLTENALGTYAAELENGNYTIYGSVDGGVTIHQIDTQILTINNADRHRYMFFNSVEYDLNGGSSAEDFPTLYYMTGSKNVLLTENVPTRDRYLFSHWVDQYGNIYQPGALLTEEITRPYILTAQWVEAIDLYLNIQIKHVAADGISHNNDKGMHDIYFTLDQRTGNGDYAEIYTQQIDWDGVSLFDHPVFEANYMMTDQDYTIYTAKIPVKENVLKDAQYTFTTIKSGYELESVTQSVDENGDIIINAELIYDPNNFDFTYTVRLDEEAKQLPDSFKPVAANVKITSWYNTPYDEDHGQAAGDETVDWYTITQHRYTYERVALDENGEGVGFYPVWMGTTDADTPMTYHYRIEVVSFEMPGGEINPATNVNNENITYLSDCEHVEANIYVTGGKSPNAATELTGAYYENGVQVGDVEAVISIHTYSVTFVPNGGTLNGTTGNTVVEPLFKVPNLLDYVPVREGGYVFDGWYLADENGNMTDVPGVSYDPLHSDITLIAKWKEPLTVTTKVIVSKTYQQENADGTITTHTIHDKEVARSVVVSLQKIRDNGYAETVATLTDELIYDNLFGIGTVSFTNVPDDGHTYRVLVITPNYTFTYQNEPESLDAVLKYDYAGSYHITDYTAVFNGDTEAVINAYGDFTPEEFTLKYEVDATAIGEGFRPENAQILITHDDDAGIQNPDQWPVISQMQFDGQEIGLDTALTNGEGSGAFRAWQYYPDGRTAEYALRLQSTTTDGIQTAYDEVEAPFYVIYHVPAYYVAPDGQSQMLVAELMPKSYPVIYELDGGVMTGFAPFIHIWSFETDLSGAVPTKDGYIFDGWYLDAEFTQPAGTVIDASVHQQTTLYAKWKLAKDNVNVTVYIDHKTANDPNSDTGLAAPVFDRILYVQLTDHPTGGENASYNPVDGTVEAYAGNIWHTPDMDNSQDVFTVSGIYTDLPSDMAYNAIASLEGYEVVTEKCTVTPNYDEDNENGTTYDVEIYLQYTPELVDIDFTVRMDEAVDPAVDPAAALVKVTGWYDHPDTDKELGWYPITQHESSYITVELDDETRSGTGTYSVWQWYLEEQEMPFFYRIEVVGYVLDDGTVIDAQPETPNVSYTGGIYTATVYAENGAEEPIPQDELHNTDLLGSYGAKIDGVLQQVGTLEAVITVSEPMAVIFHSNNSDAQQDDIFRTYYTPGAALGENEFYLTQDGKVNTFYDIPTYAYNVHNGYIFKGWYMGTEADAAPMDWNASYTEETHIYAHWIFVGEVAKENDGKIYAVDAYPEYDLLGNQIRTATHNPNLHYGEAAPGLRFIASLSERVYQEMNAIHTENNDGIEYGFVIAATNTAQAKAEGENYMLKYKHASLNGEDTTSTYSYVNNVPCRVPDVPVDDHFAGEKYRLYTAVITYQGLEGDRLTQAQNTYFIGRAYLRYFDANGLERVHYNNYTGNSQTFGGVNVSYTLVNEMLGG